MSLNLVIEAKAMQIVTSACGPGRKMWIHAQDIPFLRKLDLHD